VEVRTVAESEEPICHRRPMIHALSDFLYFACQSMVQPEDFCWRSRARQGLGREGVYGFIVLGQLLLLVIDLIATSREGFSYAAAASFRIGQRDKAPAKCHIDALYLFGCRNVSFCNSKTW
jgi:hypothetical protein